MNIVLCLNHFMPLKIAGTEVYTWALAKSLQQKGHKITIVTPNYDTNLNNEYLYDGLTVKQYAEPNNIDTKLRSGKRPPDGLNGFKELINNIKPDLVHIQEMAGSSGIGIYHLRLLKKLGVKIVFTMHLARYSCFCGTLMYRGEEVCSGKIDINRCTRCALSKLPISKTKQSLLYNASMPLYNLGLDTGKFNNSVGTAFSYPFIIKKLQDTLFETIELCDRLVILSEWYREVLIENGIASSKIELVKQALPKFVIANEERDSLDKQIKLVFIGRITPVKGLHLLLEALKNLPQTKFSLDVYGSANDEQYYLEWKNYSLHLTNINWNSSIDQKDVVSTIAKYDLLVLPSVVAEMAPLVVLEAFAAGVPVAGTNVPGISEQVKHGYNGLLFDFNSSASLQEQLLLLLDDKELLLQLKQNIKKPNDFENVVEQMLEAYQS